MNVINFRKRPSIKGALISRANPALAKVNALEKSILLREPSRFVPLWTDCMLRRSSNEEIVGFGDFNGTRILSGFISDVSSLEENRIGIVRFRDSTTAGGGYHIGTSPFAIRIQGGEQFSCAFRWTDNRTTSLAMIGLHDSMTSALPTDGVNFHLIGTETGFTLTGRTAAASTASTSATSFTGTRDAWYNLQIDVNADASLVTYTVQDETRANDLWADTLSTNIPNSGELVGAAALACEMTTDPNNIAGIMELDWMRFSIDRIIAR